MSALHVLIPALCVMAIAYRYSSAFLAARVAVLDDERTTPAHLKFDGHNYYPMGRWTLFGHHFAAITGAGPLIGPVLAAQFGFLPGLVWLVIGVGVRRGDDRDGRRPERARHFWPMTSSPIPAVRMQGYTNSTLTVVMLFCVATILAAAGWRWLQARNGVMLRSVASDDA